MSQKHVCMNIFKIPWTGKDRNYSYVDSNILIWSDSLIWSHDMTVMNSFADCCLSWVRMFSRLSSFQARSSWRIFVASEISRAFASWSIKSSCRFMSSRMLSKRLWNRPHEVRNKSRQPEIVRAYGSWWQRNAWAMDTNRFYERIYKHAYGTARCRHRI